MTNRYGNMKNGVDDIKLCKFFVSVSWAAIFAQTVRASRFVVVVIEVVVVVVVVVAVAAAVAAAASVVVVVVVVVDC